MEEKINHQKETSAILPVLLAVIVASCVIGGALFYWQNQAFKKLEKETKREMAMRETPTLTPTLAAVDEYEGWLTYTNDVYNYQFKYPSGANIEEVPQDAFSLSPDEVSAGVTFEEKYDEYTGKICILLHYQLGYLQISVPVNSDFAHVICGRTGRAYEGPDKSDALMIDGKSYTSAGFEEQGPGETLDFHNETLVVTLDDGTRIEYGSRPDSSATYADYLSIRDDIIKIVESFKKI